MTQSDTLNQKVTDSRNPFSRMFKLFLGGSKTLYEVEYSCKRTSVVNMEKWFKPITKEETIIRYLHNDIVRNESDVWWLKLCRTYCQNDKEKQALDALLDDYLLAIGKQKRRLHLLLPKKKRNKPLEI